MGGILQPAYPEASLEQSTSKQGVFTRCRNALMEGASVYENRCAAQSQSEDPKPGMGTLAPGRPAIVLAQACSWGAASRVNQTSTRSQAARR